MAPQRVDRQLPRGRHTLTRDEVSADQRRRMLRALAESMAVKGYAGTSVADILAGAGVSRETFYQQFESKAACFLVGFETLRDDVVRALLVEPPAGTARARFDHLLGRYLTALAADPAISRLYLVEIYAAGPAVLHRRLQLQTAFVDGVAALFGVSTPPDRFACEALVAAISTLATNALVEGGAEAVLALREPLVLLADGLLGGRS